MNTKPGFFAALTLFSILSLVAAESADAQPSPPNPIGVGHMVEINGQVASGLTCEFFENGTWEMRKDDQLVGWGDWEFNDNGGIDYINLSGDGGGNQTGTYTWNSEASKWDRPYASSPNAPPLSLIPPL